jgi:ligand-binding SRPBCC domain-containing protein
MYHTLRREQSVPYPVNEVFAFFSDAANLARITPPWLSFRIEGKGPVRISRGTTIRYRIGWHGLPMRWTTEIRRWDPPHSFVDVQLAGPYRLWHHTHRFYPERGGTRICDTVRYALPFGWIGRLVNRFKVRRDVEQIFDYRTAEIGRIFPARETAATLEK